MQLSPDADHAELSVPASAAYVEPVRLTAAALAGEVGLDIEEVDDVRIAVHELFVLLLDDEDGDDADATGGIGRISLRFELTRERIGIRIEGTRVDDGADGPVFIDDITRSIVAAACSRWSLSEEGRPAFSFEKVHASDR